MAGKKTVFIDWILNEAKARAGMKGVGDEAVKTQSKFQNLSGAAKGVVAGFGLLVGSKIVNFLGDAATAAAEDQKAQELLALAIHNSTTATDIDIEKTEAWIKKVSIATGVADDELRPALAELVRTTGDLGKAQEVMGVAMDIAAAKGVPLETVTKAIGKAALGNIGALGRLGVATKTADGKVMTFEDTLAEAARTMGGAAAEAADTFAGRMAIFKVKVDEAKESLGNALIPSLADAADVGGDLVTVLGFVTDKLNDIGGAKTEGDSIWSTIMHFSGFEPVLDGLGWVADKIETVGDEAALARPKVNPFAESFGEVATEADIATEALQDFEDEVRSQIDPMFNLIQKVNDLDTAQRNSGIARDTYGQGSPEHREALRKEAEAWLSVKDAQIRAANEAGLTRDAFRQVLEDMHIFTRTDIDLILADFDRVNDYKFSDKTINVNTRGDITNRDRGGDTRRARGGSVMAGQSYTVGESGTETFVPSTNGTIVPHGAGSSYPITVYAGMGANGQQIGKLIVEEIRQYEKRNGRGWRS